VIRDAAVGWLTANPAPAPAAKGKRGTAALTQADVDKAAMLDRAAAMRREAAAKQAPAPKGEKQPWERTKSEIIADESQKMNDQFGTKKMASDAMQGAWKFTRELAINEHRQAVQNAVQQGLPVPARVLEDYRGEPWADAALKKSETSLSDDLDSAITAAYEASPADKVNAILKPKRTLLNWWQLEEDFQVYSQEVETEGRQAIAELGALTKIGQPATGQGATVPAEATGTAQPEIMAPGASEGRAVTTGATSRMGSPVAGSPQYNEIDVGRLNVSMEAKTEPTSARSILDFARRAFAVPIKGRATHKMRSAAGWFDPKAVGIRLKDANTIATAIHEVGHFIDWHLNQRWSLHPPSKEINAELLSLGKTLYGKRKPPGGYKSEGWAEFVREYVVGEEAQNKAPNLFKFFTEDYLKNNPDVARNIGAVKQMVADYRFQGAEARVESQINRKAIHGSLKERITALLQWANTLYRDELAPIHRLVSSVKKELTPANDPYQLAVAFSSKAPAKARQFVLTGTTDLAGNIKGPSLKEAVSDISRQDFRAFIRWMYAKEALFRWEQGKNPGISKADAKYVYDKYKSPEWELAADAVTKWNRDVLDYLVDAGGFDPKLRDLLRNTPIYIPLFRAFAQGETRPAGSGAGRSVAQPSKPVKRMKGSGREVIDPFESMIQQAERFVSVAHKAMVAKAIAALGNEPGMADWIWKVPAPKEAVKFTSEKIKNDIRKIAVERLGLDPSEIPSDFTEPWDDMITVWQNASQYYGKDNIVSLFVDGKRQWFEVRPELYRAIEGLDQYSLPWYLSLFGMATRGVRLGATGLNASFGLVRNFIRDASSMLVTAEHAKLGPISSMIGVIKDVTGSEAARRYKALGGEMAGQVLNDRIATQRLRDELIGNWAIKTVRHPVEALRELFGITELGPRIEEFDKALEFAEDKYGRGTLDASIYALNAAQDVTTNFSRHGSIAKVLNELIPFFNAGIQGPDKVIRTFATHPFRATATAVGGLTLPALILWWWNKDEEWYEHLSDIEKANYLHFRIPGTDKIVRIPLPFELGYVFQALPVAVLDRMYRDDKGQVMDIFKIAVERSNPFDWPAAVGPAIDVMTNKSWTGAPIVSESMMNKLPEDRSRLYTTTPMRYLGRLLGVAPVQLEYLINAYTGGLYDRVGRTGELLAGTAQGREASDIPVVGTLFVRQSERPSERLDDFYHRLELLNQRARSKKITAPEMYERQVLTSVGRELSELRKQTEEPGVTAEAKNEIYRKMETLLDRAVASEQPTRINLLDLLADITYDQGRGPDPARWLPHKGQEAKAVELKRQLGDIDPQEYNQWLVHYREVKQQERIERVRAFQENERRKAALRAGMANP